MIGTSTCISNISTAADQGLHESGHATRLILCWLSSTEDSKLPARSIDLSLHLERERHLRCQSAVGSMAQIEVYIEPWIQTAGWHRRCRYPPSADTAAAAAGTFATLTMMARHCSQCWCCARRGLPSNCRLVYALITSASQPRQRCWGIVGSERQQ